MNAGKFGRRARFARGGLVVSFLLLAAWSLGSVVLKPEKMPRPAISSQINPREVSRGPSGKSEIALTFDAGKEAECFDDLVAALANAHVHSTFFVTGAFARDHADCAAQITKYGHEVGNHTWSHLDLTQQADNVIRDEIVRAEGAITKSSGQTPKPWFRAPYGIRDARVLKIAQNLGYRSIRWSLDSLDGVEPQKSPQFLIEQITGKSDAELDGAIILMHVGVRSTVDALPAIIANLQQRGFHLVTVGKLLEPAPAPAGE